MLKVDLHIHSLHSGHAYGTIYDIISEAKKKKMEIIAITDHGPALLGGAPLFHFRVGYRKPKTPFIFLWGIEANLINHNGDLDIDNETQGMLDLVMVGIHIRTGFKDLGEKKNTEAMLEKVINDKGLNAPRLTPQDISDTIVKQTYVIIDDTTTTVCALTLRNGYIVTGESAAVSKENFDEEIGREVAFNNARDKIWSLEGYLLKQKLYEEAS